MSAKIRFPDNKTLEADTWEALEEQLRKMQFGEFPDQQSFRKEMERRAMVWAAEEIEIDGDSRDFMFELSRAQLLDVIITPDSPKPKPAPGNGFTLLKGGKV